MSSLKAVFVDFDGTLVDSEFSSSLAYSDALKKYGFDVSPREILGCSKGSHWSLFLPNLIGEKYSAELGSQISKEKKMIYPKYYPLIKVNVYLMDMLKSIKLNLPIGLVTSASRESVEAILSMNGLTDFFDVVVCQEDVVNPKPHPEGYELGIALLGVAAVDCICFEDSEPGINAAKSAGLTVFKVMTFD